MDELNQIVDEENLNFLGERLISAGILTQVQLEYVLQKQKIEGGRLGQLLVHHGLITERDISQQLSIQSGLKFLEKDDFPEPDPQLLSIFNRELCLTRGFLPIQRVGDRVEVLLGDGDIEKLTELIQRRCGQLPIFIQAEFTHVLQKIRQVYYFAQNPAEALIQKEIDSLSDDVDHAKSPEKLLEYLLHLAVRERATDIHIAPSATSLHLLFRIDGVLRPMLALPMALSRLIVFIKLGAEMDISEQRRPQDGSFQTKILDAPFTIRVSILVTEFGERIVMRLLPESTDLSRLEQLGFRPRDIQLLQRIFAKPSGMVLLTGPTGSGKSTTLHAALRLQTLIERNVLTVEDPIEHRLATIAQTEVNRRAGYEFSTALRHFLRHDPDVILVGEIRDSETAMATVTASATGHLVLSTLHVASVFGVISRLVPLGLDPEVIAENLVAVINQRLVRVNCSHCLEEVELTEKQRVWLNVEVGTKVKHGKGCKHCSDTGFYGRIPIYEILSVDEQMANAIAEGKTRSALRDLGLKSGFEPMVEMAKWRIIQGQTTFDEVWRVIGESPE
jgi:general secretion pathway protein E